MVKISKIFNIIEKIITFLIIIYIFVLGFRPELLRMRYLVLMAVVVFFLLAKRTAWLIRLGLVLSIFVAFGIISKILPSPFSWLQELGLSYTLAFFFTIALLSVYVAFPLCLSVILSSRSRHQ